MPNQSSAPEKPRFSVSTSRRAEQRKRQQQRHEVGHLGVRHHRDRREHDDGEHSRKLHCRGPEPAIEAASACPQRPRGERQRGPREPRQVLEQHDGIGGGFGRQWPEVVGPATARPTTRRDRREPPARVRRATRRNPRTATASAMSDAVACARVRQAPNAAGSSERGHDEPERSQEPVRQEGDCRAGAEREAAGDGPRAARERSRTDRPAIPASNPSSGDSWCARSHRPTQPTNSSTGIQRKSRPKSSRPVSSQQKQRESKQQSGGESRRVVRRQDAGRELSGHRGERIDERRAVDERLARELRREEIAAGQHLVDDRRTMSRPRSSTDRGRRVPARPTRRKAGRGRTASARDSGPDGLSVGIVGRARRRGRAMMD